jgi:hypothetical protein
MGYVSSSPLAISLMVCRVSESARPSQSTCASGPYRNVALQERRELIRSRRQDSAATSDQLKIETGYRITQLAYNYSTVTTRGYSE